MELAAMKKVLAKAAQQHSTFVAKAMVAERYYRNKNDILNNKSPQNNGEESEIENPLRNADNRITRNWHGLLVNQKAAYMLTYPPSFETKDKGLNADIVDTLGDEYPKIAKDLCVNASNCGIAWIHVWIDKDHTFQYAVVDAKQIIAIYTNDLKKRLAAVIRVYDTVDDDGEAYTIYEYWTDKEVTTFRKKGENNIEEGLQLFDMFTVLDTDTKENSQANTMPHEFGEVPFIPFYNNNLKTSDLDNIKPLIDVYDKVFSGLINDIEDIQEVIFVLTNYGGQDLDEFVEGLKKYKAINFNNTGPNDKSGMTTLCINIPIEAREKALQITHKAIFEQGQGVDPDPEKFGNTSGEALKYLYSLLELKAGLAETEFRIGFARLVRLIAKYLNKNVKSITQTWTRSSIKNDVETATIAKDSQGVISKKTIRKNHPWVDDVEQEEKQCKEEETMVAKYTTILEGDEDE